MSNPKFVRNEVTYITNEIDYDKLAEAIVKAQRQETSTQNGEKTDDKVNDDKGTKKDAQDDKKICLVKAIWRLLTKPEDTKGQFLSASLALVITTFYVLLGFLAYFFLISVCIYCSSTIVRSSWDSLPACLDNLEFIGFGVILGLISILVIVISVASSREASKETDKHYIVSVFSGLMGFVALIVAIVALNQPADNGDVVAAINSLEQTICNEYAKYAEQDSEELEDFQREILDALKALEEETNEQVA